MWHFKHVVAWLQPAFECADLLHSGAPETRAEARDYMLLAVR